MYLYTVSVLSIINMDNWLDQPKPNIFIPDTWEGKDKNGGLKKEYEGENKEDRQNENDKK